jgi:mannosyltransferase OCH1-like enzyme
MFHQIWLGDQPLPREYEAYRRSWTKHHPGWELRVWTEETLPGDLERKEIYDLLRRPAERSDMLRLELLHRHGGVYVDSDFECRRSIEPLLDGVTFFCAYIEPGRVNNALIGSIPGHTLLERGIRELRPRTTFGPVDKEGTGPLFFNRLVSGGAGVTIFAEALFYPRTPGEAEGAYAVHHAGRSWKEPADLLLDAVRAEQRLAIVQDELAKMEQRYRLAEGEAEALRGGRRGQALALRARRFLVRRLPKERIRYVLGTLRARALRR